MRKTTLMAAAGLIIASLLTPHIASAQQSGIKALTCSGTISACPGAR